MKRNTPYAEETWQIISEEKEKIKEMRAYLKAAEKAGGEVDKRILPLSDNALKHIKRVRLG